MTRLRENRTERGLSMRKGLSEKVKYVIEITSNRVTHDIKIRSIFGRKENRNLSIPEMINEDVEKCQE